MPVQGWYLDDETYRRLQDESSKQVRKPGEILSEIVRVELAKRESEEDRPKVCGKCNAVLEWHLTAQEHAILYAICLQCGWNFDSKEVYRTSVIR